MAKAQSKRKKAPASTADNRRWADLADLALIIAREIQVRGYADEAAVPLSPSEGMVMRYLQTSPDAAPSTIADAVGLQRTNLSTVLGALERKGLIERRSNTEDARGVSVSSTERGTKNYALVRREWAHAVATAAGNDASNLDAALALLRQVEAGLTRTRPSSTTAR